MPALRPRRTLLAALLVFLAGPARAEQLDWQVKEGPAGPVTSALRDLRDGVLGVLDDAADLQLAVFADAALLTASALEAGSDAAGLIDDNPVTQHLFKGIASKSLAKTAYLLHCAGAETILGSHGLETQRYLADAVAGLNPLLDEDEPLQRLPLDPLAFLGEGLLHAEAYTATIPLRISATALLADGIVRPAGNLVRMVGATSLGDRLESRGQSLVQGAVE
jgi:hypothetical protein